MLLSSTQIAALQWAVGQIYVEPKANTLESVRKRGLVDGENITDAGRQELQARGLYSDRPDSDSPKTTRAELCAAGNHDSCLAGECDVASNEAGLVDDGSSLSIPKATKTRQNATVSLERRRAKNRQARKSRRINRKRAK